MMVSAEYAKAIAVMHAMALTHAPTASRRWSSRRAFSPVSSAVYRRMSRRSLSELFSAAWATMSRASRA